MEHAAPQRGGNSRGRHFVGRRSGLEHCQAVQLRAAMDRVAWRARGERYDKKNIWPEYSELSCFACHHSLTDPKKAGDRNMATRSAGQVIPPGMNRVTLYFA